MLGLKPDECLNEMSLCALVFNENQNELSSAMILIHLKLLLFCL